MLLVLEVRIRTDSFLACQITHKSGSLFYDKRRLFVYEIDKG